jgi:tetratricopeptide (TPR) repeat protein
MLLTPASGSAQTETQLNDQGVKLIDEGKYKEALPIFEKLVAAGSGNTVYRYNRYFNLKRYKAALSDYKELVRLVPNEPEYYFQVGNLYEHLDSLNEVEFYYSKAIALEPDYFLYYFKRGTFFLKSDKFPQALRDFNKSLSLHNSLHNRGIILYKTGQSEKACEDWCQAQLLGNHLSGIHMEKNCKTYPAPCLLSK